MPNSTLRSPRASALSHTAARAALLRRPASAAWNTRLLALLTGLMGLVNLLSATTPSLRERVVLLQEWLPLALRFGSHLAAALSGFALLLLARGLWRRKRTAWSLTLALLIVSAFSHLLKGLDYEEAALAVGLALWLLQTRAAFSARSDPPSLRHAVGVFAVAVAFTLVYGVLGLSFLDRHFSINFDVAQSVRQVLTMFTQFEAPDVVPITPFGRYFADSIYMVAAATMGYALLALVSPVLVRHPANAGERARARRIVEQWGRTSLAWFALSADKSYYFSDGGSVIAFVVSRTVCLALGDVIGPPDDVLPALRGFCASCAGNDWQPAFVGTEPDHLSHYEAAGLSTLCIGYEAIVPVRDYSLAGGRSKDIRGRVARLQKLGYVSRLHPSPLPDTLLAELRSVSDEWLSTVRGGEKSFFIGAFDDDYIRHCPVMAVHGPDNRVCAFANLYPEFGRNEATIDLMRRRRTGENGIMELLFTSLFFWAKEHGYDTFNLGLSPLAGVGHETNDPAGARALRFIYERSRKYYNFQGLHGFKSKFHPQWSPRYLIYPGASSLPAVTLTVIRAHAGENFLWNSLRGFPKLRRRERLPHVPASPPATPSEAARLS